MGRRRILEDQIVQGGRRHQFLRSRGATSYQPRAQSIDARAIETPACLHVGRAVQSAVCSNGVDALPALAAVVDQRRPDQLRCWAIGLSRGLRTGGNDGGAARQVTRRYSPEQRAVGAPAGGREDAVAASGDQYW